MIDFLKLSPETIEALEKLGAYKACFIFLLFCALVSPGMLILFKFQREMFLSIDSAKLLMLALSLSVPILLISSVIGAVNNKVFSFLDAAFSGSALTLFISYLSLLFSYLFSTSFLVFLIILGAFLVLTGVQAMIIYRRESKKSEKA